MVAGRNLQRRERLLEARERVVLDLDHPVQHRLVVHAVARVVSGRLEVRNLVARIVERPFDLSHPPDPLLLLRELAAQRRVLLPRLKRQQSTAKSQRLKANG
jgi:hypothetical protein